MEELFSSRLLMMMLISRLCFVELSLAETNKRPTGDRSSAVAASCPAPKPCECERTTDRLVLNCRQHDLNQVPTFSHSDEIVDELTLAKNRLVTLPNDAFRGLTVRRLDLSENQLVSIAPAAFRGLEARLEELLVQLNGTAVFPSEAVAPLTRLRVLNVIGYGRTSSLPNGALASLGLVQELRLTDGGLRGLLPTDVTAMRVSLSVISLSNNPLGRVPTAALSTLSNVTQVHLSGCQIARLDARAFATNWTRLKLIDLSHNQLEVGAGRIITLVVTFGKNVPDIFVNLLTCYITLETFTVQT